MAKKVTTKRVTDRCPECDGRGEYLDAPGDVLSGRAYMQRCEACQGTGVVVPSEPTDKEPQPDWGADMSDQDLRDTIIRLEREAETLKQTLESLAQAWEFEGHTERATELRNTIAAQGGHPESHNGEETNRQ